MNLYYKFLRKKSKQSLSNSDLYHFIKLKGLLSANRIKQALSYYFSIFLNCFVTTNPDIFLFQRPKLIIKISYHLTKTKIQSFIAKILIYTPVSNKSRTSLKSLLPDHAAMPAQNFCFFHTYLLPLPSH